MYLFVSEKDSLPTYFTSQSGNIRPMIIAWCFFLKRSVHFYPQGWGKNELVRGKNELARKKLGKISPFMLILPKIVLTNIWH